MPIEAVKSSVITNSDAVPSIINTAQLSGGRDRMARGVCPVVAGASIGSTYRFARIKSNDLIKSLRIDCGAIATATAMDVGIYQTTGNGGGVVDATLFASAVALSAALMGVDISRESGTIFVADMEKPLWQLLGLASDPQREYEIAGTLTTASTGSGSVCLTATLVGRY